MDGASRSCPPGNICVALYSYETDAENELALETHDLVTVIQGPDKGWWYGDCKNTRGWFPSDYVKIIDQTEVLEREKLRMSMAKHATSEAKTAGDIIRRKSQKSHGAVVTTSRPSIDRNNDNNKNTSASTETTSSSNQLPEEIRRTGTIEILQIDQNELWFDPLGGEEILKTMDPTLVKRQDVIFELLCTERDFIRDLQIIIKVFSRPLSDLHIIGQKDHATIFSNVEQLLPVNKELLHGLEEKRAQNPIIDNVGDVFLRVTPFLKVYTIYTANNGFALTRLAMLEESKSFREFTKNCQELPVCRNLDISTFLLKPVQRLCKYPLLIKEIMKYTPEDHNDRKDLEICLRQVNSLVEIVNESTRKLEGQMKVIDIQAKLEDDLRLVTLNRCYVREERVNVLLKDVTTGKPFIEKKTLVLFNDALIVVRERKNGKLELCPDTTLFWFDSMAAKDQTDDTGIGSIHLSTGTFFVNIENGNLVEHRRLLTEIQSYIEDYSNQRHELYARRGTMAQGSAPTDIVIDDHTPAEGPGTRRRRPKKKEKFRSLRKLRPSSHSAVPDRVNDYSDATDRDDDSSEVSIRSSPETRRVSTTNLPTKKNKFNILKLFEKSKDRSLSMSEPCLSDPMTPPPKNLEASRTHSVSEEKVRGAGRMRANTTRSPTTSRSRPTATFENDATSAGDLSPRRCISSTNTTNVQRKLSNNSINDTTATTARATRAPSTTSTTSTTTTGRRPPRARQQKFSTTRPTSSKKEFGTLRSAPSVPKPYQASNTNLEEKSNE